MSKMCKKWDFGTKIYNLFGQKNIPTIRKGIGFRSNLLLVITSKKLSIPNDQQYTMQK